MGIDREGSGRAGPTDPVPSCGHPGPCSPCSASLCAAPRSPSPPWWPSANASEGRRLRQPAGTAAPAQQPGAQTGSGSSLQPLAPSSIPLQTAMKSRSKAEPQAPGTTRVQGTEPPQYLDTHWGHQDSQVCCTPGSPAWELAPKPRAASMQHEILPLGGPPRSSQTCVHRRGCFIQGKSRPISLAGTTCPRCPRSPAPLPLPGSRQTPGCCFSALPLACSGLRHNSGASSSANHFRSTSAPVSPFGFPGFSPNPTFST